MIPSISKNKYKPSEKLIKEYDQCVKKNLEVAKSQSFTRWQAIWDELNRADRERLGL